MHPKRGTIFKSVGEEFVRTEVQYIPAKITVIDYYKKHMSVVNVKELISHT